MRRPLTLMTGAGALALLVALTALTGGRFTSYTGAEDVVTTRPADWWTLWSLPPLEFVAILLLLAACVSAIRARGADLTGGRIALLAGGTAILLVAVCSPLAGLAQGGILSAHMLQHTLIGGFAPLLLLAALPRAVPDGRPPRDVRRVAWPLVRPVPALAVWTAVTVVWLLPPVHHEMLVHQSLWVVQQVMFFTVGALLWMPVLDRWRQQPEWFGNGIRALYMAWAFFVGLTISNAFWFVGTAFYASHAVAAEAWGLDPQSDQGLAGTVMMVAHCFLTLGASAYFVFRHSRQDGLAQRLREAGLDPAHVRSAMARGELEDLARATGVAVRSRPGID